MRYITEVFIIYSFQQLKIEKHPKIHILCSNFLNCTFAAFA